MRAASKAARGLPGARGLAVLFALLAIILPGGHAVFDDLSGRLREKTFDSYQSVSPRDLDMSRMAVVAIDEVSLARFGRWPWPRERVAALVDAVTRSGASAVGLDVFFSEPDDGPGGAQGDASLAGALARAPSVLAMSLDPDAGPLGLEEKAGWTVVGLDPGSAEAVPGGIAPLPMLADAVAGLGIVRVLPDRDGVIRKVPLIWAEGQEGQSRLWPALSMEMLRVAQDAPGYTLRLEGLPTDAVRVGGLTVPLGEDGRIRIIDTPAAVPHVSAASLLEEGQADGLDGRIALIAVDAAGIDQYHLTARGGHRLGADIHAILMAQMLEGRYLFEAPHARAIERGMFLGGSAMLLLILSVLARRPLLAGLLSVPVILAPLAIGAFAYASRDMLLDGVQPAAGLLVAGAAGGYMLYREAERRRSMLQKQFSQFLSPEVVKHLAATDAVAALRVEDREISAMLVDVRGFTAMSSSLGSDKTVTVVNHFLEIANREIFARGGTIDKYMGDAVLAIWNAPLEVADHADRAIDCARAIISAVSSGNAQLQASGLPGIDVVATVESGVCSVGNMGTEQRIDYTAIGPAINMVARLEVETKKRGEPVLIGPGAAARTRFALEPLGEVHLRGMEAPCTVFRPA
ncbi:CHASE2 domain-containing protein [Oricola thermophila]|uniref:Adenylate/guanylate cyclase domain-containing protein n=1 Tax=Oricola thermophila TaxID=2742145 RepID=A0A6N1VC98_9HYPH|nr:adenylate/guanylate cyclase domain-containing protein [Oricola thermophila]QKV17165.1 adenylate/guanylate cyclase domain-containing protein [Oricola thermophila]